MNKALEREGFEFEGTMHRGIDDAVNLAKIFCKYLNLWRY
jgi:inhibitor of KinA sporulation pathway (predicted exonuclease)